MGKALSGKLFCPLGANSFLEEWNPFWHDFLAGLDEVQDKSYCTTPGAGVGCGVGVGCGLSVSKMLKFLR